MTTFAYNQIEKNLNSHMQGLCGYQDFAEVLDYGVLPAGKLFRPKLATACFLDNIQDQQPNLKLPKTSNIALISSALEIHHAYTLIHDDLPCMDDDDYRRGRESTHKKFGQWQAVLAGDALLHHSHTLIGRCQGEYHYSLRAIFNWGLGAKGLILGQVFDLGGLINEGFDNLLRTHELKTGRLIQCSLLGGLWAARTEENKQIDYKELKSYLRLGSRIGIVFQLLDDLSELTEDLSEHEKSINPFLKSPSASFAKLSEGIEIIKEYPGKEISRVLSDYFIKMKTIISEDLNQDDCQISHNFDHSEDLIKEVHAICALL